jgi:hypothetical protein
MKDEIEQVGEHPEYGPIYKQGEGVGSRYFVEIASGEGVRGGSYTLCSYCKDPIIYELGQQADIMLCDASAHLECSFGRRLKFGPIKPDNVIYHRGPTDKQSNLFTRYIQVTEDLDDEI